MVGESVFTNDFICKISYFEKENSGLFNTFYAKICRKLFILEWQEIQCRSDSFEFQRLNAQASDPLSARLEIRPGTVIVGKKTYERKMCCLSLMLTVV